MLNWNVYNISPEQLLADKLREIRVLVEQGALTAKEAFLKISAFEDSLRVPARMDDSPVNVHVAHEVLNMMKQVKEGKVNSEDFFTILTEFEKQVTRDLMLK